MSSAGLTLDHLDRISGFGQSGHTDAFVYRPTSVDEVRDVFALARTSGRQVTLRGSGRSYGDANVGTEKLVIDITRMNRILHWDKETGVIECEAGTTIEGLWRYCLEDGWWPPVVTGTMYPTLAGALAMNVHGKNNFCQGTIGEHVLELDVLYPNGTLATLTPSDERFFEVVSSAGLLGVITRVRLQMHHVASGNLKVYAEAAHNWDEQFEMFQRFEHEADYMVSWVDCFGRGNGAGRGQFHAAWYDKFDDPKSRRADAQDLPPLIMGFFPKAMVWKILKMLCNRTGMHLLNWMKYVAGTKLGNKKTHEQSLVAFSFLLDYVPDWRKAYEPGGFIQYQTFVPKGFAQRVFAEQVRLQQEYKLESYLGVLKRHREDKFLFSHAVDGYSLALDFKVTERNRERLWELAHKMNDLTLSCGGRFYFAKDSTLRPSDVAAYLGENLDRFFAIKAEVDPENLLTSDLAERVGLTKSSCPSFG
ncbi:MAG: FAD-binding protein [Armatimonadetes bacterium]|nr:FAD-binding protein [Armatimonadota bacterium]